MYSKAVLHSDGTYEVLELDDVNTNEVKSYLQSVYSVYPEGDLFAVRRTKEEATMALRESIEENIRRCELDLAKLKRQLNLIV